MRQKKIVWFKSLFFVFLIFLVIYMFSGKFVKSIYPIKYRAYIEKFSEMYGLDKFLVMSVIKAESNFNRNATSIKDARGLMQITPSTGNWIAEQMNLIEFSPDKLYDPEHNILMGCWYLNNLSREFNGNYELILSAYNAGRGNVNKWLQNNKYSSDGKNLDYIPFKETELYLKKINLNYNIYKRIYNK